MDALEKRLEDFINELEEASDTLLCSDIPVEDDGNTIKVGSLIQRNQKAFDYAMIAEKLREILNNA